MSELRDRADIERRQLKRLNASLERILASNEFYRRKFGAEARVDSFEAYRQLPFTQKTELSNDQIERPPYGTNLTYAPDAYIRIHKTSGTTGRPLRWLDTEESWNWWGQCWAEVYRAAGVTRHDRIFFAFSFGPFIGFWSAYEGARRIGALALPGGAMSSEQRIDAILSNEATALVSTPTYALRLAEVAEAAGIDIASSAVRATIHAGEPGASIPAAKQAIETAWGAKCYDHAGATEVGAWGYTCEAEAGMRLNEEEFIFEIIDPKTGKQADEGELVVSNLGRVGMPIIRYRTGDHVRWLKGDSLGGRPFRGLDGGVVGRVDDALLIRGVVVFPSSIEAVVRRFPQVAEYAVEVSRPSALDVVTMRVELKEGGGELLKKIGHAFRSALGLSVAVERAEAGTLPRFEMKARRVTDKRAETT